MLSPLRVGFRHSVTKAGVGQKRSFAVSLCEVCLQIGLQPFEPIAAVHNNPFVCCIGCAIPKWKQLTGSDFDAL